RAPEHQDTSHTLRRSAAVRRAGSATGEAGRARRGPARRGGKRVGFGTAAASRHHSGRAGRHEGAGPNRGVVTGFHPRTSPACHMQGLGEPGATIANEVEPGQVCPGSTRPYLRLSRSLAYVARLVCATRLGNSAIAVSTRRTSTSATSGTKSAFIDPGP